MPDITMCKGDGCEVRDNCYRYTAKPGLMQSYFAKSPRDEKSCLWIIFVERGETDASHCLSAA